MKLFHLFKKEQEQFSQMIAVFVSVELNKILIAPHYVDESWVRYEQEEIEEIAYNDTNEILGQSIKRNLALFAKKNMSTAKRKPKDWPSYKASKLKSIKEFKRKYHRISVNGANEANIILVFEADMKSIHKINITRSISAFAENQELGLLVKKMNKVQMNRTIE